MARIVDDFNNLGKIEAIIVDVAIGEILITRDKIFIWKRPRYRSEI
ncbi:immunity protein Imm3 [Priestia megaterium]|nr:immunity protein Imm3 [Priestia megaterium]